MKVSSQTYTAVTETTEMMRAAMPKDSDKVTKAVVTILTQTPLPEAEYTTKVEKAKKTVEKLKEELSGLRKEISKLVDELGKAGAPCPGGECGAILRIPMHMGVIRSNQPGELGKLETHIFALQKDINHRKHVVKALKKDLAEALTKKIEK